MDFARAGLYPDLALSGQYTRQRTSPNSPLSTTGQPIGQTSTYNNFAVPLDLSYEVDLWGRVRRSIESARAQAQASADDLEAVKLAIQAEVAVDYFNLRTLDSEQAVLRSSVEVFAKSYDLTLNRRAGGVATDLDVAQAETVLKTTQAQLPQVALHRAQFEHALALFTGRTPPQFSVPESNNSVAPPTIPAGPSLRITGAQAGHLRRRTSHGRRERQHRRSQGCFFPVVQLNGFAGRESVNTGNLLSSSSRIWALGPSLTLPLFEGGRLRAGLRLATAAYVEMVANYRQTVLTAFSEVEDNLAAQSLLTSQYQAEKRRCLRPANSWRSPTTVTATASSPISRSPRPKAPS